MKPKLFNLGAVQGPTLPSGKPMEVFENYDVVLLKKVYGVKAGTTVRATLMPHGSIYLNDGNGVFLTNALQGTHFKF